MDLDHEKRLTEVEQRAKANQHRLDKLEPVVEEIHHMSETLVELTNEMKHVNKNVEEFKAEVEDLKQEPGEQWKGAKKTLLNAFLSAIGGAIAGGLIYLLTVAG